MEKFARAMAKACRLKSERNEEKKKKKERTKEKEQKNQAKQVSAGLECGITIKNFNDFQKKDIIEVYNSTISERTI